MRSEGILTYRGATMFELIGGSGPNYTKEKPISPMAAILVSQKTQDYLGKVRVTGIAGKAVMKISKDNIKGMKA